MPECEFCLKPATVGVVVQAYTPQKTFKVIDDSNKVYPKYEVYLCAHHKERGLYAFLPNSMVGLGHTRKL